MVLSRFEKFLKSEQFKMICSILLILFLSLLIKMTMPDSFEHYKQKQNITFRLKFKEAPLEISNFNFSVKDNAGNEIDGIISNDEIDFNDYSISDLKIEEDGGKKYIELKVTSETYENIILSGDGINEGKTDSLFEIDILSIESSGYSKNISLTADLKNQFK